MKVRHRVYEGYSVDKDYCREMVHDTYGVSHHQCLRKAKVFEDVEMPDGTVERMGFCRMHSTEAMKKRMEKAEKADAERRAAWKKSNDVSETKRDIVNKVLEMHGLPASDVDGRDFCYHQLMNMAERLKKLREDKP